MVTCVQKLTYIIISTGLVLLNIGTKFDPLYIYIYIYITLEISSNCNLFFEHKRKKKKKL